MSVPFSILCYIIRVCTLKLAGNFRYTFARSPRSSCEFAKMAEEKAAANKLQAMQKALKKFLHEKNAFTYVLELVEKYTKVDRLYAFLGGYLISACHAIGCMMIAKLMYMHCSRLLLTHDGDRWVCGSSSFLPPPILQLWWVS